jgi:hypothetical protein
MIGSRKPTDPNKRVVIPVTICNGKIVPFYGGELPQFREGAVMDLLTEEGAFLEPAEIQRFHQESFQIILPEGSEMFAVISFRNQDFIHQAKNVKADPVPGGVSVLVPFWLLEPLRLHLRGTRKAELLPCECDLRIDGQTSASSVNEAYTRLSERYEPWRRSHTGNVFTKVYFRELGTDIARPIDFLREQHEAEAEKKLFHRSGVLPLKESST